MEDWEIKLLEKINNIIKHKNLIPAEDYETVCKAKRAIENGVTLPWKRHKKVTAINTKLIDKIGSKDFYERSKKRNGLNYSVIK